MRKVSAVAWFLAGVTLLMIAPALFAQTATSPYTLTAFAGTPPAGATAPDDLAISANGKYLWIGYGNGVDTFGKGGPSNAVEYDIATGAVLKNISIPGHLDGLKINPVTGEVWATENEDGNPTLAVIDPESGAFKIYRFDPTLITGGMDDLVFVPRRDSRHDADSAVDVYIVTSSQVDTTTPVIVRICGPLRTTNTCLKAALPGAPQSVWNVVTNQDETSDMIGDPDSMTINSAGELVLDNRSDDSLYIVRNPKAANPILRSGGFPSRSTTAYSRGRKPVAFLPPPVRFSSPTPLLTRFLCSQSRTSPPMRFTRQRTSPMLLASLTSILALSRPWPQDSTVSMGWRLLPR